MIEHDVGGNPRTHRLLGKTLVRIAPAPWKLYYGTRNMLFVLLRQKASRRARQRMLVQFALSQGYQSLLDLLFQDDRAKRFTMRGRGLWDAVRGNLGKKELA